MQKKYYICDGGSLAIGTPTARFNVVNRYGDGEWAVEVHNGFRSCDRTDLLFMGSVEGSEINVYDYDCLTDTDLEDPAHILFTLSGRYGVFARVNSGDIVLEKWS